MTVIEDQLQNLLNPLYGSQRSKHLADELRSCANLATPTNFAHRPLCAADILLVTYGDSLVQSGSAPLATLKRFVDENLTRCFSAIHILPFFPFSSDDGFAVSDYGAVRDDLGDWGDVYQLTEHFELMFDLVINHCSREHEWFAQFISGQEPGSQYFITQSPGADYSAVVRPRSTPLFSSVHTSTGVQEVWTTFGEDQVDLKFENPQVLLEFVAVLFDYVRRGASYIRLDAIGFLWKLHNSNCMSLPQTHAVVKIMRLLLEEYAPATRLLTETNVPHVENVSYFGAGDEAHLVYQFSLAPLLICSYLFQDASQFGQWLATLDTPPKGATYLNFIASHDGVGLRPLEGLVSAEKIQSLVDLTHDRGGFVSMRTAADGAESPYELNITLFSLFGGQVTDVPAYVGAHQLLLALQGVPAIYVHSLFGTLNDLTAVERSGRTRSINRGRWQRAELLDALSSAEAHHRILYGVLKHSLELRRKISAFAPDAHQRVVEWSPKSIFLQRISEQQTVLVIASFSADAQELDWPGALELSHGCILRDLLTKSEYLGHEQMVLQPFQVCWIEVLHNG